MRCRNCDYPLWDLRARTCPECGVRFAPSEYQFTPQSVRFCCPHCDHPYYGTGARGHLAPASFQCLRCGRAVTMDEMVLRPGPGVEEQLTRPDTMPWLDRRQRGRVRAWFQMIGKGLTALGQVIAATPPDSPLRPAWTFALITTALFVAIGGVLAAFLSALWTGMMSAWLAGSTGLGRATIPVYFALYLLGSVAFAAMLLWLWTLAAHGLLWLTGGWSLHYRRTCQAILYSAGANVFTAVPCFGVCLGLPLWAASAGLMLKEGQQVSGVRAAVAAGAMPGIVLLAPLAVYLAIALLSTMGSASTAGPWNISPGSPSYQTSVVNYGVAQYGALHGGAGPVHAIDLALDTQLSYFTPNLTGPLFCDPGTKTRPQDVPLGDGTLDDFSKAGRSQQLVLAAKALQAQDPAVVAHRLGDFVFTYHGAALNTFDPELWLVVMLPDPDVNGPPGPNDRIFIGTSDFAVTEAWFSELPALLEAQNRHRATLKLPPLPDLTTVTHGHPAVAPP